MTRIEKHLPLIFTLFFVVFGVIKFLVQGPAWLHQNGDVNYVYLFTGLDYWSLLPSGINDQPALTVKLYNAIIIGLVYGFRNFFTFLTMEQDVIANCELYIRIISLTVFAVLITVFYKFLRYSFSIVKDKSLWLIASISFFSSYIILVSLFVNKPEPYLIISGLGIGSLVLKRFVANEELTVWSVVGISLFAILSKITVAPFLLILLVSYTSVKNILKPIALGTIIMAIIIFIWKSEFSLFLDFIINTSTHGGAYGSGDVGFYDDLWRKNLLIFFKINAILCLILILGLVRSVIHKTNTKAVVALFTSYLIFFIFILKNPFSHYYLSCYGILPAYILVSFDGLNLEKYKTPITILGLVFLIYRGYLFSTFIVKQNEKWISSEPPQGVQNYYSSSKAFCVLGADIYQGYRHKEEVAKLFPNDTIYWFDKTIRNAFGVIPHSAIEGEFTITGSSKNIEKDNMLSILSKTEKEGNFIYKVKYNKD